VQFRVFKPTFDKELLVVNDTRFRPDVVSSTQPAGRTDSLRAPSGTWPTRAELDTFLFAIGGVRWKMTAPGKLSPVGVFRGYAFDSLGTRTGAENPTIPLNVLGTYRHIVWLTDLTGADQVGAPTSNTSPITTLRFMSQNNKQNTLATWVNQGGQLLACGGGFGHATNAPWNKTNDGPYSVRVYASDGTPSTQDLVPGRFMYDLAHWRSEFRVYGNATSVRFGRFDRKDPTPAPSDTNAQKRRWKGRPWPNPAGVYTTLPNEITYRDPATDPLWPFRTNGDFYVPNPLYSSLGWNIEYLVRSWQAGVDNDILELDPALNETVVLDTVYMVFGTNGQINAPGSGWNSIMTHYHGYENGSVTFLGAGLWAFRKTDCQAIVDCVLQSIWHMTKSTATVAAQPAAATRTGSSVGTARAGQPVTRTTTRSTTGQRSGGFSFPQRLR